VGTVSDAEVPGTSLGARAAICSNQPIGGTAQSRQPIVDLALPSDGKTSTKKNQPIAPRQMETQVPFRPWALNFFYLITPFTPSGESDQLVLGALDAGRFMTTRFCWSATSRIGDFSRKLRIVLCRLTLEELTRIWEALREPYRLSVCLPSPG